MTTNDVVLVRPFKILWAGRLAWDKNVQTLIRAVSLCPPWFVLTIVGEGKMKDALKRLSVKLGIENRVFFAGKIPHDEMSSYFQNCDVYCQPSLFLDALPRTVIEACEHGKPSIVSDRCGTLGCEKVVRCLDVDGWASALLELAECSSWVVPESQRALLKDSLKIEWWKKLLSWVWGVESAGIC